MADSEDSIQRWKGAYRDLYGEELTDEFLRILIQDRIEQNKKATLDEFLVHYRPGNKEQTALLFELLKEVSPKPVVIPPPEPIKNGKPAKRKST